MLNQINPQAGAVDVGSESLHVAVSNGPTRVFKTFTSELYQVVKFFQEHGVQSVAMEATGVYWISLYEVLEEAGLKLYVVNGAHVKNLPGRKSDMSDCQWLAELHAHGLLRSGFVPPEPIRRLRDYQRLRQDHIQMGSAHILHMQKALDRMNLKIHEVLSQVVGQSGLRMIRAILRGEREPEKLVELCDCQILSAKRERMVEALKGFWHPEQLFALGQALEGWEFYQKQMAACDQQIAELMEQISDGQAPQPGGPLPPCPPRVSTGGKSSGKPIRHNAPLIADLHQKMIRFCRGHDLEQLPSMTDYSALQIVAEVGTDMSPWPTDKHFVAWLGLAPASRVSGKSRRREKRFRGRAGRLFCLAARSLARSKYLALGGFYRRIRATRGAQVANIAAARKLAQLFYWTLKHGFTYVEEGLQAYEAKYRAQSIKKLKAVARHFGLSVISAESTPPAP